MASVGAGALSSPDVLGLKAGLRREVWAALVAVGAARFPGAEGRIPNFVGAERAAARLAETSDWLGATTLKANPDSPQLPVRAGALRDGKTVYMAVPRLASEKPFLVLDPAAVKGPWRSAASIGGASRFGRPVDLSEMTAVDLVITGCVAVSPDGARLGKGGGFSDLEYALAWEAGLIGPSTVVATTVHDVQVVDKGLIPMTGHDFRLDLIVTPERLIRCRRRRRAGVPGIRWEELTEDKISAIPLLSRQLLTRQILNRQLPSPPSPGRSQKRSTTSSSRTRRDRR
jgi:5-formyltetrahydrofolate cyclo-ligase